MQSDAYSIIFQSFKSYHIFLMQKACLHSLWRWINIYEKKIDFKLKRYFKIYSTISVYYLTYLCAFASENFYV